MKKPPIRMEDLEEDQYQLAQLIGMDAFLKMVEAYGGSQIYIPMKKSITLQNRNEQICAEFNGENYLELGLRYNLSVNMIRTITDEKRREIKKSPLPGQISLFQK